ncbi:MAG TPA: hypothetical protein ENI87_05185 [bacterium]|nr:hypothetical protein [bacterium]
MRILLRSLLIGAVVAQAPAGDAAALRAAFAAQRAGRHEQALAAFDRCIAARADRAEPQLRLNAALCALHLLRSRDAEERVAPLLADEDWGDEAAFLLALAHGQHAERAVVAARLPDAEPMAWMMAVRAIRRAEGLFRRCCELRPDWGPAVRNLERTIRRRREIEAERDAARPPDAKQEDAPEPAPQQPPPDPDRDREETLPDVDVTPLTAAERRRLQERVQRLQRQKVRSRRRRARAIRPGERDW